MNRNKTFNTLLNETDKLVRISQYMSDREPYMEVRELDDNDKNWFKDNAHLESLINSNIKKLVQQSQYPPEAHS